ncbi:MAG: FRG domain-containing protein [Oscillospiraceae bacterium]|nr:FRG domain-containing protein [Oscillospiraceae bacterium]
MHKQYFSRDLAEIAQHNYEGINRFVFPCIQKLLDFLDKFDTSDCFFRGQSSLWEIKSSLHRHHSSKEQFQKACNISASALEWLINNPFISSILNGNDDYAMAIAQHYGCPTDLIDITTNFRTAAYFAVSENEKHTSIPNGCIWVFTQKDLRELRDILKTNFFGCFEGLPQSLQDKLAKNDYRQLLQIDMPQLSRLNAQDGAFLWDVCGLLTQQLRWRAIGTQFVFKHNSDEKNMFDKEKGRLLPFPNQLESVIDNSLTDLLISFITDDAVYTVPDGKEEYIVEIAITLSNYQYSDFEIAKVLFEWLKILKFLMDNNYIFSSEEKYNQLLIFGYVNDWITKYYGCPVTKLYLGEGEAMSRFWLPENYSYLEREYQVEFSTFDKSCFKPHKMVREYCDKLPENTKILLYQHKPQKIMSYEAFRKMFIELILPQSFAFRRIEERVFIPDYIDKIALPVFGRKIFGLDEPIESDENYGDFIMV